jgi:hypothetical protein
MAECELLDQCGFFKKHSSSKELVCKGFINKYCKGDMMDQCERKKYRSQKGTAPPDDMMPNGRMLATA